MAPAAIATRSTPESGAAGWPEILPEILQAADRPESLKRAYLEATVAVQKGLESGAISQEQADQLTAQLTARLVEAQFSEMLNSFLSRGSRRR